MESSRLIRKVIRGREYTYDRLLDVIYMGSYLHKDPFDRTQVDSPVDLCLEVTQVCNMTCRNCFSKSARDLPAPTRSAFQVREDVTREAEDIIRVCITGGEPLLHPDIEDIIRLPALVEDCGFVLSTNGTHRPDLDHALGEHGWLVAVSLHGQEWTHNAYSRSESFRIVEARIENLARHTVVHIYSVLHDEMSSEDVEWLFRFRDNAGAAFLRFIEPRPFGRFRPLCKEGLREVVRERLDRRSGLKTEASLTRFIDVHAQRRLTR